MKTEQAAFFVPPAESDDAPPAHKEKGVITRADLSRSLAACHRVEDEIWSRLRGAGCKPTSSTALVRSYLATTCAIPPAWCEVAAWDRMVRSFRDWSHIFGDLDLFLSLRHRRDD
jgi:hypothetical protein